MSNMMTVHEFLGSLREGKFTPLGSYPKYWVTLNGSVLSYESCIKNVWEIARTIRDDRLGNYTDLGWRVIAVGVNYENPDLRCDDTGERIESAYAEG